MIHSQRTFKIYGTGSLSDPAHLIKCAEFDELGTLVGNYSSFEPVKNYIEAAELRDACLEGESKELNRICKLFGVKGYFELKELAKKGK